MTTVTPTTKAVPSAPLWVGIVVLPIIFAWFTLDVKKDYSNGVKGVSLAWMVFWIIALVRPHHPAAPSKPAAPAQTAQPQDHATAVAEAKGWWIDINSSTKQCSDLGDYVTRSIRAGDRIALYENGQAAKQDCLNTALKIDTLAAPENLPIHAPDNVKDALKVAAKEMSNAFTMKSMNYGTISDMANNGMGSVRPSELVELKTQTSAANYKEMMAIAKIATAFQLEAVSMSEYSAIKGVGSHKHHHS